MQTKFIALLLLLTPLLTPAAPMPTGKSDGLICSSYIGGKVKACPENIHDYINNNTGIPIYHACDNGEALCIGEGYPYNDFRELHTIYDIDNNQTKKIQVTITPTLLDSLGRSTLQQGRKIISEIAPTPQEKQFTNELFLAVNSKQKLAKQLTLIVQGSYATDASGVTTDILTSSLLSCKTALNYLNNDVNCMGDLNKDIDLSVQDNAVFNSFISALEKAQGLINVVTVGSIDYSDLQKLNQFIVILYYDDGSKLAINVEFKEGAIEIKLNKDASRTSKGLTFLQFIEGNTNKATSYGEAKSMANSKYNSGFGCAPTRFDNGVTAKLVNTIIIKNPDGTERHINIYKLVNEYVVFNQC